MNGQLANLEPNTEISVIKDNYNGITEKYNPDVHTDYCAIDDAINEVFSNIFDEETELEVLIPRNNKHPSRIEKTNFRIKRLLSARGIRKAAQYYMESNNIKRAIARGSAIKNSTTFYPSEQILSYLRQLYWIELGKPSYKPTYDERSSSYKNIEIFPILK